jgi:hypothetical protein
METAANSVQSSEPGSLAVGGAASDSVLVTGSHNVIVQAEQVMVEAAGQEPEAELFRG